MTAPDSPEAKRTTARMRRIIVVMTVGLWIAVVAITALKERQVPPAEMPPSGVGRAEDLEAALAADTPTVATPAASTRGSAGSRKSRKSSPQPSSPGPSPSSPLDHQIPTK